MTLPTWHEGLDPVSVELPVEGDAIHRIEWAAGALRLLDHGDPDAEVALSALGGGRCACLDVLEAWDAQADDPAILTIGRRHPAETVEADRVALARLDREAARWRNRWRAIVDDMRVAGDAGRAANLHDAAAQAERKLRVRLGLVRILSLGDGLHDRLQVAVLAVAEQRWSDRDFLTRHRARLRAALVGRARPALAATGLLPSDPSAIDLLPPGAAPVVGRDRVALPLTWLTNVWGRGVAVAAGRFVVQVRAIEQEGKVLVLAGVDGEDWRFARR